MLKPAIAARNIISSRVVVVVSKWAEARKDVRERWLSSTLPLTRVNSYCNDLVPSPKEGLVTYLRYICS